MSALSLVRVNLSDGQSSQGFSDWSSYNRYIPQTVDFEEDVASIRAVSAYPGDDFTAKIKFYNEDDVLEHQYHPYT